jgi:hypothetical protein
VVRRGSEITEEAEMGGLRTLDTDWITGEVIGGAIDVHRYLGPGLLEHTYEVCLEAALRQRGLMVERQVLSYLRFAELHVGLLFNFNVDVLSAGGWKRVLRAL